MPLLTVRIPPDVAERIQHLPPETKRLVRASLDALAQDPLLGKPLERELKGLWTYPARAFRIVYQILPQKREIRVYAVAPRKEVYKILRARLLKDR